MLSLGKIWQNLNLGRKIIIFGILMVTLPIMGVWIVSGMVYSREQSRITREFMTNTLHQNITNIDSHIRIAAASSHIIAFDPMLIQYLRSARTGNLDLAGVIDCILYFNRLIMNYETVNQGAEISIYLSFPELLAQNGDWYISLDDVPVYIRDVLTRTNSSFLILAPEEYKSREIFSAPRPYYTIVESVSGWTMAQGILALITIRIDAVSISNILNDTALGPESILCLHDGKNVFFTAGNKEIGEEQMQAILTENRGKDKTGGEYLQTGGNRYQILRYRSGITGWELTALINEANFMTLFRRTAVMVILISLLFVIPVSIVTMRYMSRFLLQEYEMQALENQIKPHFLYNTLDVIKFKALRAGSEEVAESLDEMARYFRTVLAGNRRILTLLDVAEQCRLYVTLQNFRYGGRITLKTNIPADTAFCTMPRFLLQPLIENAIIHGIRGKPDPSGVVTIDARAENGSLLIDVIDNGTGIPPEILPLLPENPKRCFGLYNVHARIRVSYGAPYGISVVRSDKNGACVRVHLPYKPDRGILVDNADIEPAEADPSEADFAKKKRRGCLQAKKDKEEY
jgi:sensor histidine kinase YesM